MVSNCLVKKIQIALASSIAFGVAFGCGGSGGSTPSAPANPNGSASGTLAPQTVYLSKPADTPLAITDTSLTLPGTRSDIKPGTVLLSSLGNGFVRDVTSVAYSGGTSVFQTTPAGLTDAFSGLHATVTPSFDMASIGDITSGVPGLTMKWVQGSTPQKAKTRSSSTSYNTLELDFNKLGISGSGNGGMTITGSAQFQATPAFSLDIDRAPGDLLPSVAAMSASYSCSLTGSLQLSASAGGSLGGSVKWFDKVVGPPVTIGWLVFLTKLTVESDVSGDAAGHLDHTQAVNLTASAGETYVRGSGWNSTNSFVPSLGASETNVDGEFNVKIVPIKVTVAFELYGVAGVFAGVDGNITGQGVLAVQNNVEGIQADVTGGAEGSIGLIGELPKSFATLFGGSGASFAPVEVDFPLASSSLFSQFFPLTKNADITVEDNGDPSDNDDTFLVTLDGASLGQTDKGSTGVFPLNNLTPGNHTLSVTYTDQGGDDETGDPPASLALSLANGLTFSDGSTSQTQGSVPFDIPQVFTIVVPRPTPQSKGRTPTARTLVIKKTKPVKFGPRPAAKGG